MTIEVNEYGHTTITPAEGKYLTNGETYADSIIYLGKLDNPANWQEVDEIPSEEGDYGES